MGARGKVARATLALTALLSVTVVGVLRASAREGGGSTGTPGFGGSAPRADVDWPQFHNTPDRTGVNPSETLLGTDNVDQLSLAWTYIPGGEVWSSPAVVDGVLYIGSDDNKVYALSAATGTKIWSYTTGGDVRSSPAVVGGVVYVGSDDDKVYALNAATGIKIWSYATSGDITDSSPLVSGGLVYIGSLDGNFYALHAADGSLAWKVHTWAVRESAAISGSTVYVGSDQSILYALDANTGATKWTATLGGRVRCTPAVRSGTVYVGADDYRVYAYNATSGALKWKSDVFPNLGIVRSNPAVWNGLVYVNTGETDPMGSNVYALDSANGDTAWSHGMGDYATSSPAVANGVLYTGSFDHQIYAFDATTGDKLWSSGFNTMAGGIPGSVAVVNGMVYVGSKDDGVYAFADTPGDPVGDLVTITNNVYTPSEVLGHDLGYAVLWTNDGPGDHTATDSTGMDLYDSGVLDAGDTYAFTFVSAGIFKYTCTVVTSMTGKIKAPVVVEPTSGGLSTVFTITWASAPPPSGYVYDVKIRRPGGDWELWKDEVTTISATFVADSGKGTYDFKAHIKRLSNGDSATYSPLKSITVT